MYVRSACAVPVAAASSTQTRPPHTGLCCCLDFAALAHHDKLSEGQMYRARHQPLGFVWSSINFPWASCTASNFSRIVLLGRSLSMDLAGPQYVAQPDNKRAEAERISVQGSERRQASGEHLRDWVVAAPSHKPYKANKLQVAVPQGVVLLQPLLLGLPSSHRFIAHRPTACRSPAARLGPRARASVIGTRCKVHCQPTALCGAIGMAGRWRGRHNSIHEQGAAGLQVGRAGGGEQAWVRGVTQRARRGVGCRRRWRGGATASHVPRAP